MTVWTKKLTKRELKHLAEASSTGKPSLVSLKTNLKHQLDTGLDCPMCEAIARKIGLNEVAA